MAPNLPDFLAEDFERIGDAVLDRAAGVSGSRLLLSGATGFFGRNLLALLAHLYGRGARFHVTALSRDPEAFMRSAPWASRLPWLTWLRGDASMPWLVSRHHDLLLHAATDTSHAAHLDRAALFDGMLAATRQALACASRCGVRRLLLTGSGAQYAPLQGDVAYSEDAPACDPMQTASAYGEAKRVSELLAVLHARSHGCSVVATRCFAFVGPGLPLDRHFAIGNFIGDALAADTIMLKSPGLAVRSYLYSADLALWLLLLLLEAPGGTAVNVGSDHGLSVYELACLVRDHLAPGLAMTVPKESHGEPRPYYLPQIDRARSLGLEVWTPLPLAIERTAQWHRMMPPLMGAS